MTTIQSGATGLVGVRGHWRVPQRSSTRSRADAQILGSRPHQIVTRHALLSRDMSRRRKRRCWRRTPGCRVSEWHHPMSAPPLNPVFAPGHRWRIRVHQHRKAPWPLNQKTAFAENTLIIDETRRSGWVRSTVVLRRRTCTYPATQTTVAAWRLSTTPSPALLQLAAAL